MKKIQLLLLALAFVPAMSQNKLLTIQDAVLKGRTSLAPKRIPIYPVPGTGSFAFTENNTLKLVSATGEVKDAVTLREINSSLKASSRDTLSFLGAPVFKNISDFYFSNKQGELLFSIDKKTVSAGDRKQTEKGLDDLDEFRKGEQYAYVSGNNLFVHANATTTQVTQDGSYNIVYGKSVHRDEFGIHKGTFWSPRGNLLAFYRMDQTDVTDYPIVDWSAYPAKNENIKYPMAGNKSHYVTVGVFNTEKKSIVYLNTEGPRDQYLTNIAWSPDERYIYIAVVNREQNHMKLNEYEAGSGNFVRTLFEEKDDKYVEPMNPLLFLKSNPNQFIWQSRRDGFKHLYLYDLKGNVLKQLTKGNWEVKEVSGFDAKGENLFFHANEQAPVNQDFYSVNIRSGKMTRLTKDNGFHSCMLSENGQTVIDNFSSCYTPREYRIIQLPSGKSSTFLKAENPISDYKTGSWRLFSIKNSEGTDLYCRMFRPVDFDSTKKYPVLVYLYNGPHSQMVTNTWMAGGELWYQFMAQKGFIVFTLDGRGTSHRGKAFEQAIHRQLGEKEMEDQLKGVEYLKSLPYVDASRIGVHGWSYGGFMTTSLMTRHPGVFKVGVAGGPVIDWSYYEIMYGERYMDSPQDNKEGYERNNLLNHVQNLKGKLLMIHGAQDNVVVWQHSVMYLKKAVEKGVQLDYFIYPGHEHNVLGKDRAHLMEKICTYFLENL